MTKIDKITFVLEVVKKILELIQAGKSLNQAIMLMTFYNDQKLTDHFVLILLDLLTDKNREAMVAASLT